MNLIVYIIHFEIQIVYIINIYYQFLNVFNSIINIIMCSIVIYFGDVAMFEGNLKVSMTILNEETNY